MALADLSTLKKEAVEREKKLWGGKLNKEKEALRREGITFLGNTIIWEDWIDAIYNYMITHPQQILSMFLLMAACVISHPSNLEWSAARNDNWEKTKTEEMLQKRGLLHTFNEWKEFNAKKEALMREEAANGNNNEDVPDDNRPEDLDGVLDELLSSVEELNEVFREDASEL